MSNTTKKMVKEIEELKWRVKRALFDAVIAGEAILELYNRGEEEMANKSIGGVAIARAHIELVQLVGDHIRSGGSLNSALVEAINRDFLNKILKG